MPKIRRYTHFIAPTRKNFERTNRIVMRHLSDTAEDGDFGFEANVLKDVVCADGKRHDLLRCPSGLVFMLWENRAGLEISFRIFCQEGNGQIRDITRIYAKKRRTRDAKF